MPDKSNVYSQSQFVAELGRLCSSRETGTLFIVTAQGVSASAGLQQGTIVSLAHRSTFGNQALTAFQAMDGCKLKFTSNVLLRTDNDLPPTPQILSVLGGTTAAVAAAEDIAHNTKDSDSGNSFGQAAPAAILTLISRKLEAELAVMLGQRTAQQLCDEAIAKVKPPKNPNDVRNLVLDIIGLHVGKAKAETISKQIINAIGGMAETARRPSAEPKLETAVAADQLSDMIDMTLAKTAAVEVAGRLFGPVGPILVDEKLQNMGPKASRYDFESALLEVTAEIGEIKKSEAFVSEVLKQMVPSSR